MFEENWAYRIIVILALCILLVWTYLTNEETLLNYISGNFVLDTRLIWQIGIFGLLSLVLFYLMQSTLDYKSQNEVLKKYMERLQKELEGEREALQDVKSESGDELMRLESFIVTISDMARQISSVLETDQLLRLILRKAIDLLGSQNCAIFKSTGKDPKLVYVDSAGYKKKELEALDLGPGEKWGQVGLAAESGMFISRKLIYEDPGKRHILDNDKIETIYCQPIVHNSKTLALICVGDTPKSVTPQQAARLLSTLANFGAIALINTELVEKIREQSRRDSLTWLYNHQFFQDRLTAMLKDAIRNKEAMGLLIIDIDHFKKLNDTHGHQAGDFVLKQTASILNSELRSDDLVARYGGEEFVAVLPRRNIKASYDIAERLRKRFADNMLEFEGKALKVTISVGVSALDPSKEEIKKNLLIRYADEALYQAKEAGRDKVVMHKE